MESAPAQSPILSIHIPKCAGVTLRNILKEHFGPGFVLYYWQITDALGQIVEQIPVDATCIHGHYQTDQLTGRFPASRLMTWVRDPVERVVSSYYHRLRDPDPQHPVCHELHARKLSLTDYAALPLVRNEITHFFGSKKPEDFAFIGIVEDFDRSFARLSQMLGLPAELHRRDNVNPLRSTAFYELEPEVRRTILGLNEKDAAIYAECLQLWGSPSLRMEAPAHSSRVLHPSSPVVQAPVSASLHSDEIACT